MKRESLVICRCGVCDTLVEVLDPCGVELICCGQEMSPLAEHVSSEGAEHAPIISALGKGVQVTVGDGRHPMQDEHHIAWIELVCDGKSQRQFLSPGEWPVAFFEVTGASFRSGILHARRAMEIATAPDRTHRPALA